MRKQDQDETPTTPARGGAVHAINHFLERVARKTTLWVGGNWAFAIAVCVVLAWLLSGPLFHYSESWQLVINTGTTIVTFLMVFLIQRSQSKDALALQLKLDEVVAALSTASNELVSVEDLSEEDLEELRRRYHELSERARHVKTRVERAQADRSRKAPARPR